MPSATVYDKAKYHYDWDFPANIDPCQAYVHIGMFLGWACCRGLLNNTWGLRFHDEIGQFVSRKLTAPQLLRVSGGELTSDVLNKEGNAFAGDYFTYGRGQYLNDYHRVLARGLPSPYCVEDNWENFDRISRRIDQRYSQWQGRQLTAISSGSLLSIG